MTTYNRILSFNSQTGSWQNTACDSRGNLNVNSYTVSNNIGAKDNVFSGDLAYNASTPHFDVKQYGVNSVISYEDNLIADSGDISIFVTSSASDAVNSGVFIGSLQPITTGLKRYASSKLNLGPFSYLWVVNNNNQLYPATCNVSVYSC
jgi:hypothetical protein